MQIKCELNANSEILLIVSRIGEVLGCLVTPDWLDVLKNEASF